MDTIREIDIEDQGCRDRRVTPERGTSTTDTPGQIISQRHRQCLLLLRVLFISACFTHGMFIALRFHAGDAIDQMMYISSLILMLLADVTVMNFTDGNGCYASTPSDDRHRDM